VCTLTPPLWAEMVRQDFSPKVSNVGECWAPSVDKLVTLATKLGISDFGLHLAAALAFEDLTMREAECEDWELSMAACLKLADAFDEHSHEYYQREKTPLYVQACAKRWSSATLLAAEKDVARRLNFRIRRSTPAWFLRACAHAGGSTLVGTPCVVDLARLLLDLSLLASDGQTHASPLRAQVALLVALYSVSSCEPVGQPLSDQALPQWRLVWKKTCSGNQRDPAASCLALFSRVLMSRSEWHTRGLRAAEERHAKVARKLPRGVFPPNLVNWLLPRFK